MATGRAVRALYSRASEHPALRRPLAAIRTNPLLRRYARRHVGVLLGRGTSWANVDGALRLLAEDPAQPVVFGPWQGGLAGELLYWAPFVRWARVHFSLDPARVAVVSESGAGRWYGDAGGLCIDSVEDARRVLPGAAVFRPEPVLALVERYRCGAAPPRPLLKRARHVPLAPSGGEPRGDARPEGYVVTALEPTAAFPDSERNRRAAADLVRRLGAERTVVSLDEADSLPARHSLVARASGLVAAYSGIALLGALSGVPVIALRSGDGEVVEADVDLAVRVVSSLGGSLNLLDAGDLAVAAGVFTVSTRGDARVDRFG